MRNSVIVLLTVGGTAVLAGLIVLMVLVAKVPSPAPATPTPSTASGDFIVWTAGDDVGNLSATHPDSYNCSFLLVLDGHGIASAADIVACYSSDLATIRAAANGSELCGVRVSATKNQSILTITCPADCDWITALVAKLTAVDGCNLGPVTVVENGLVMPSSVGYELQAPYDLAIIDGVVDTTYQWAASGTGVTTFVLDTGVDATISEFAGRPPMEQVDLFTPQTPQTGDCNGHGTMVASLVGGAIFGAAKTTTIVSVRTTDCNGVASLSMVTSAMQYVGTRPETRKVASISLGPLYDPFVTTLSADLLAGENTVTVIAAGNGGTQLCSPPNGVPTDYPDSPIYVGAFDSSFTFASFSNYGDCVKIFAPGVNVPTQGVGGVNMTGSGTSFGTPLASAAAASAWDLNPTATATDINALVLNTSTPYSYVVLFVMSYDSGALTTAFVPFSAIPSTVTPSPTSASPTSVSPTPSGPSASPTQTSASPSPSVATSVTSFSPTHSSASPSPSVGSSTPVPICSNYTAYTAAQWGQTCNIGKPKMNPVGCYRDTTFATTYPTGVFVGCPFLTFSAFRLNFTSSYAVDLFLPQPGPPARLTASVVNPVAGKKVKTDGWPLAANVLAAKLNRDSDAADAAFGQCTGHIGDLCFNASVTGCGGHTFDNVIKAGDLVVGNCFNSVNCAATFVDPFDYPLCSLSPAAMNNCLAQANAAFGGGDFGTTLVLVPC